MRIPKRYLEHSVILEARKAIPSSTGAKYQAARKVSALVVDKRQLVTDQREGSETKGQEITASTSVLMQPEDLIPAGSLVTIWPGTPQESKRTVVSTAYGRHSIAPESAQLYLA